MKKPKKTLALIFSGGILLSLWLWVGIVEDPEFTEYGLCFKKHPTFKIYFYSPPGMSDNSIENLPPDLKAEEHAYRRYVLGRE